MLLVALLAPPHTSAQVVRIGAELQVNSYTPGGQYRSAVASDADGDYVVTWNSIFQDGGLRGVFARRFASSGQALATEFQVNTVTAQSQTFPAIAAEAGGDFVVAWHSLAQDGSAYGVFARRFSAAGVALAAELQVNSYTAQDQRDPEIAADADGDFVVVWNSFAGQDGSLAGIFGRRFSSAGSAVAAEFQVNSYTTSDQRYPVAAMEADGDFVVAWSSIGQDGDNYSGIFARRFSSSGTALATEFQVNVFTLVAQYDAAIAADADGDFVVAWSGYPQDTDDTAGVFARRFSSAGAALGGEFEANVHTLGDQTRPGVILEDDGDFTIAWSSAAQDGSSGGIFARRFSSAGQALGGELLVNSYTSSNQGDVSLAADDQGRFVVTWDSSRDGSESGVFAQRLAVPAILDIDGDLSLEPLTDGLLLLRHLFGFTGGALIAGALDPATCVRCDGPTIAAYLSAPPAPPGQSAVPVRVGPELQVNSYTTGIQGLPHVSVNASGDFVVAWTSFGQDGSESGIFARRFSSAGASLGPEVQINAYTTGQQHSESLVQLPNGGFVVAWESVQDGDFTGVFERRFSSASAPLATEFQVDGYTLGLQGDPMIASAPDGDFTIVWQSPKDGQSDGIFARLFTSSGNAGANDLLVNNHTVNPQRFAALDVAGNGNFVVAWASASQDFSNYGLFARRFSSSGAAIGREFQVNVHTTHGQTLPSVAVADDGDFMVTWNSYLQDGYGYGIFARTFTSAGASLGVEFQVATATLSSERGGSVVPRGDGTFTVVWSARMYGGYTYEVFGRSFSATGSALTGLFQINTYTPGQQFYPSVAADGNRFIVAWQGDFDGSTNGIFVQRLTSPLVFDIDGDGMLGPLTDGLLALRYLFGFTGATLVQGAVGPGCTRCDAPAIAAYLATLAS